ncbi:MAG: DUF2304 domain-containing protein [Bacilli bacterium]|nr:DUF2304 domain-containing protein [Bacilli bacterium]
MNKNLMITLIVFGTLLILVTLFWIYKKKMPIKYSLFWFFAAIVIILVGTAPSFVSIFTKSIGFETTSNFIIGIIMAVLLLITMLLTIIIAELKRRITILMQEVSILKSQHNSK